MSYPGPFKERGTDGREHDIDIVLREARRYAAERQTRDPLQQRARIVADWRADTFWPRREPVCRPLYKHPGFVPLLLPGTRAHVLAVKAARRAAFRDELAASERRRKLAKAPVLPLFPEAA